MNVCIFIAIRPQCVYLVHSMRIPGIRIECLIAILMHEQITREFGIMNICITRFGIRIGDRKYLDEYTLFGSVSLCIEHLLFASEIEQVYNN